MNNQGYTRKGIIKLRDIRFSLILAIAEEKENLTKKFKDIPWGYGMRAYSRLKHFSSRKLDTLQSRLDNINAKLDSHDLT